VREQLCGRRADDISIDFVRLRRKWRTRSAIVPPTTAVDGLETVDYMLCMYVVGALTLNESPSAPSPMVNAGNVEGVLYVVRPARLG